MGSYQNMMQQQSSFFVLVIIVGVCSGGLLTRSKCDAVPRSSCAQVYDDGECHGWRLDIAEGEIMFKWWHPVNYWYRNDIESVSVRQGGTFTIRAGNADRHVTLADEDEYEDYDEKIQSI